MGVVDRVVFPLTHIRSEWFATIVIVTRVMGFPIVLDEIRNERVWAGRVVRRIGQCQDVLGLANGESLSTEVAAENRDELSSWLAIFVLTSVVFF